MISTLSNALIRINHSAKELANSQARFGFELSKLLLAIQANEAYNFAMAELGNEKECRKIVELCDIVQELGFDEMEKFKTLNQEVDMLVQRVINSTKE